MVKGLPKRRGVSDIVANLLMAVVVLSVGLSIYLYSQTFFQTMTGFMGEAIQEHELVLYERFMVTRVDFNSSAPDTVTVWVFNYGEVGVEVKAVFINGELNEVDEYIPQGEWRNITVPHEDWGYEAYRVLVVSSRGKRYETVVKP